MFDPFVKKKKKQLVFGQGVVLPTRFHDIRDMGQPNRFTKDIKFPFQNNQNTGAGCNQNICPIYAMDEDEEEPAEKTGGDYKVDTKFVGDLLKNLKVSKKGAGFSFQ